MLLPRRKQQRFHAAKRMGLCITFGAAALHKHLLKGCGKSVSKNHLPLKTPEKHLARELGVLIPVLQRDR